MSKQVILLESARAACILQHNMSLTFSNQRSSVADSFRTPSLLSETSTAPENNRTLCHLGWMMGGCSRSGQQHSLLKRPWGPPIRLGLSTPPTLLQSVCPPRLAECESQRALRVHDMCCSARGLMFHLPKALTQLASDSCCLGWELFFGPRSCMRSALTYKTCLALRDS